MTSVAPSRTGSWKHSVKFLRDAAVFTSGEGLALGDHYHVRVPGYRVHVITDPALAEEVLVTKGAHFEKSRIYWRELKRIIGDAMGSLEGDRWEYLRRLQQPFFTPRAVREYLPAGQAITTTAFDALASRASAAPEIAVVEMFAELNTRIVLSVLFGRDAGDELPAIARRIADGEATIAWRSKFPWRPITAWFSGANQRARRHKAYFAEYARGLEAGDAAAEPARLLDVLLRIRNDDAVPAFPESLVRNEIIVHLGASTETQSVAEGWCLYLLWKHPEILARVRHEADAATHGSRVGLEHSTALPYTKQVLEETMRLYPPCYALIRDCVTPTELAGQRVRVGDVFFVSVIGLHRSPRLWDEPDRFLPERFGSARSREIRKYQYLPFGAGKHICIGQHVALPMMTMAIAQFVRRFDWSFADADVRPVSLSTLKPSGAFHARVTSRHTA